MSDDKLLTVKIVAEQLSVSTKTVYRLIEEGQLKALRIGSEEGTGRGVLRVKPSDLKRYMNRPQTNGIAISRGSLYDDDLERL